MEKMSILMGKLGQQKVASGPGQKKKLVLFGWVCLHEHPPFWQFILPFFPFHAGVLRRTTPYVCNAFQWLWNLSTNLCLFLKFLRSVKKGPPSLNQARTELIWYPAICLGLNSDILSILLVYDLAWTRTAMGLGITQVKRGSILKLSMLMFLCHLFNFPAVCAKYLLLLCPDPWLCITSDLQCSKYWFGKQKRINASLGRCRGFT